jgi:hypothetical protein
MNEEELMFLASKYNLEQVIEQELNSGLSIEEIVEKYDL